MKRVHISFYVDRQGWLGAHLMMREGGMVLPSSRFNTQSRLIRAMRYFRHVAVSRAKASNNA